MPLSKAADRDRKRQKREAAAQARALLEAATEQLEQKLADKEPRLKAVPPIENRMETVEDRQRRFFELLTENFSPTWALHRAGISKAERDEWIRSDPKAFAERMSEAKEIYAGNLQEKAGLQDYSRNPLLLMELLKAHNEKFGRPRLETIKRVLTKLSKAIHKLLIAEFGKAHAAQVDAICKQMDAEIMRIAQPFAR